MIDCGCDEILLPQGSDGVNGKNAYTVTTASFTQPVVGNSVTITVSNSLQNSNQWAIVDQIIRVTDASGNGGWYEVTSIPSPTQITATLLNYPGTTLNPTTIQSGAGVSPAGLQGPAGSNGDPGSQGLTGPPNSLSITPGGVTTLAAGQPATATILGDAPNQTLSLGIPQGNPGAPGSDAGTIKYRSWNKPLSPISLNTSFTNIFFGGIESSPSYLFCQGTGDSFRINFYAKIQSFSTIGAGNQSPDNILDLQFSLETTGPSPQAVLLEPPLNPSPNNGLFFAAAPYGITLKGDSIGAGLNEVCVSATIFVQRIDSNNMFYRFEWSATNIDRSVSISNVFCGYEPFIFYTTGNKAFRVNARRQTADTIVRCEYVGLIIESLNLA